MAGVITALKLHARKRDRVEVHLNGRHAFDLPKVLAAELKLGQPLDDGMVKELQRRAVEEAAYRRGLRLVSLRPRSEEEIRRALDRHRVPVEIQQAALARLRQAGLLNDREFAQAWVENRQAFRPRSRRALRLELKGKGVAPEVAEGALIGVDDEASAYQAAARLARRLACLPEDTFRRRLGAALARRGFDYEVIQSVVKRLWGEHTEPGGESEDAEWNSTSRL
ncbi:MAG: regulatory protein RecX [Chloroflexota bacterium]